MKRVSLVRRGGEFHWVGDGLPVRTLFFYGDLGKILSPFLLLDYVGPRSFPPTRQRLGVGPHPHRGFETVTIVYSGEIEHRDTSGGGGTIGPGDVQWMTAASGIVHEEFHGAHFAERGGVLEAVQLWVNLPAEDKMAPAHYQSLSAARIPTVAVPGGGGTVRVIAGDYRGTEGPARTFTPVNLWDLRLEAGSAPEFRVPAGTTTALVVLSGEIRLGSGETLGATGLVVFDREGDTFTLEAVEESKVLVLNGEPIDEPLVGQGPFVMNTEAEIMAAYADYHAGNMGRLLPAHTE